EGDADRMLAADLHARCTTVARGVNQDIGADSTLDCGENNYLTNAAVAYRQAISESPANAEAHRGLGLTLVAQGEDGEGRSELEFYLRLAPSATDYSAVEAFLRRRRIHMPLNSLQPLY